ncbi:hypothetical protein D9M69_484910 [compost metagenome]
MTLDHRPAPLRSGKPHYFAVQKAVGMPFAFQLPKRCLRRLEAFEPAVRFGK